MKLSMTKDELVEVVKDKIGEIFPGQIESYDIHMSMSTYGTEIHFEFTPKPMQSLTPIPAPYILKTEEPNNE